MGPEIRSLFILQIPQQREQHTADGISQRDGKQADDAPSCKGAAHPEIEHIRYAVLSPAQDEHHYAEDQRQIFAGLVRIVLVSLHRDIDQDIAQDPQEEQACQAVIQLGLTHSCRLFCQSRRVTCECSEQRDQPCAGKVTDPNDG